MLNTAPNGRDIFAGFVTDDAALDILQPVVAKLEWRLDSCHKGGMRAALQSLSVSASPAILLVDLSECADPLENVDALAEVCEPGTVVIAIGQLNDVSLYRELIARGIYDYLAKPLQTQQIEEVLLGAQNSFFAKPEEEDSISHVATAVIGTRGGVGTSMIATSLAWLLSTEHKRSTALLDLDVHFGTAALTLDLEPGRGLIDAIESPARIDTLFIERAMVRANDRLSIMSAEAPMGMPLMTDGSAFVQLAAEFRESFQASVIDLPRTMMINFPQLLADVNALVVTTEFTLAAARDTIRTLAWLKANAPHVRPLIVANKVHPTTTEISEADFVSAIERPVNYMIPFDQKAMAHAARRGTPFIEANQNAKSAAPMLQIARRIVDADADADAGTKKSGLAGLLNGFDLSALLSKTAKKAGAADGDSRPAAARA